MLSDQPQIANVDIWINKGKITQVKRDVTQVIEIRGNEGVVGFSFAKFRDGFLVDPATGRLRPTWEPAVIVDLPS